MKRLIATTINALEKLNGQNEFRELVSSAAPAMKSELAEAQAMLKSSANFPPTAQTSTGASANPKKQSD